MKIVVVLIAGFAVVQVSRRSHEDRVEAATIQSAKAPPLVNVMTVGASSSALTFSLPGETAAWNASTIYARVDGYVEKWNADIGDTVTKGQVLAVIETPDLDAQLAGAEAKLRAAEAVAIARQADAEFARTTFARWRDAPKGVVSEQEREAKKAGYDSAIAHLNEAKAQVGLDRADVERYSVLARFKQVTAPYDGRITERHIDIGNLVNPGSSSGTTALYKIAQNDPIRVFVDVPQSAAADMKVGVAAAVRTGNRVFAGKIARTADSIDPQARTLKVEVDLPNPDQALVPGMYVDVAFDILAGGLPQVPAAALIFRSGGPEVAVVDAERRVAFHKVAIGRDNGNTVEIAFGIKTGDIIALNISNQIGEGDPVEAVAERAETRR